MLIPEQRSARAAIAANARWSREDPAGEQREHGARGQAGLVARFEREAREYEAGLTDAEYARRAKSAYKAHMMRLAFASSKARARPAPATSSRPAAPLTARPAAPRSSGGRGRGDAS